MIHFIEAKVRCKMCQREIVLQCDPHCPPHWADLLSHMACCDHCYDFRSARLLCEDKMVNICSTLEVLKNKPDPARESKIRDALGYMTKVYCRAACKFYNVANQWSSEFVDLLMEKPEKAREIFRVMDVHLKRQQQQARPVAPDP
jgi:hypothetical protein